VTADGSGRSVRWSRSGRRVRWSGARWAALGSAAAVAVLVAVFAVAPASSSSNAPVPLLGKPAPDLSGPVINGTGHAALASLTGKWVLVNFFASYCPPCQAEMPQLSLFARQHTRTGDAAILGVEYDATDVASARSYLVARHASWPVVDDATADVIWGVHGIPESYLVSPAGLVVAKYTGELTAAELDRAIAMYGVQ
jgi:cytochrome c biogenesis protein CcmG/thiol:disulfide interchange protein DsbE